MVKIPFFGCSSESSKICFNKILTKLWLDKVGVETTPFLSMTKLTEESMKQVESFFDQEGSLFIKASNQGSSVGCYPVNKKSELKDFIEQAFKLSDFVIIEKQISARELEVSAFEYENKIHATKPGEIICPPALRPSTMILVAMLGIEGRSILRNVYSIKRGYENIVERLNSIGADIEIVKEI